MRRISLSHHRLNEDVAVLRAAASAGDMQMREAVEVAGRLPACVAFIVLVVRSRLRYSERKSWPDKGIPSFVSAKRRVNLR